MNTLLSRGLKPLARAVILAKRGDSIPIIAGPLKGRRIPKSVAVKNLGMLVRRYEPIVIEKILSLSDSIKVGYDVGSNVGYIALALCHCTQADVYAFEPVQDNVAFIRMIAAENHLASRMTIVLKAVSDENGLQQMHSWRSSDKFFLETARDEQKVDSNKAFTVETCTIDSFVFDGLNKPPDFIKIDVEGAEDLVVKGALRTLHTYYPTLLIEIHGPKNAEKTWTRLADLQYRWQHLGTGGKEKTVHRDDLPGLFSKDSWTAHFLLSKA